MTQETQILLAELIIWFSRFECAMRATDGYNKRKPYFSADWHKLKNRLSRNAAIRQKITCDMAAAILHFKIAPPRE